MDNKDQPTFNFFLKLNLCLNLPYYNKYYFQYGNFKFKQNQHGLFNCAVLSTLLQHRHIFNFILSASCSNDNKLKITLQLPLAKGNFN